MPLVSMRQLLDHAAEHSYGLPAFNVNNLEQVQAIMEAAAECDSPVIMQASAGARKYAGEAFLRHLIDAAALEGVLRILSFMGLGIALIGIGWAYGRVMRAGKAATE